MQFVLVLSFIAALVLKLLHVHYHTVLLLVVVAIGVGASAAGLRGAHKAEAWCRLAFWTWSLHLVALLKLFPFRTVTLSMAVVMTVAAVIIALRQRPLPNAMRQLAGAVMVLLLVMAVPTSARFHFTNLRFSLERDTDHVTWDKYSFLLMREGHTTEALTANDAATEAARKGGDERAAEQLHMRREHIAHGNWERYSPLQATH